MAVDQEIAPPEGDIASTAHPRGQREPANDAAPLPLPSLPAIPSFEAAALPSLPEPAFAVEEDPFLSSMTFAFGACDCGDDECGAGGPPKNRKRRLPVDIPGLPVDILNAMQAQRPLVVTRSQERKLIYRAMNATPHARSLRVWSLTMPGGAEPLVEFGSPTTHRLVWVHTVNGGGSGASAGDAFDVDSDNAASSTATIHAIGEGILGSAAESTSRTPLPHWKQGTVQYVPPSSTAVGWSSSGGMVVLKFIKVQMAGKAGDSPNVSEASSQTSPSPPPPSNSSWIARISDIVKRGADMTASDADLVRSVIHHVEEEALNSSAPIHGSLDSWEP